MQLRLKPVAALLPLLFVSQLHAQQSLEPVVVTATRVETRVSEVLSDITVIDRAEIERSAGGTVIDLLSRQPGVQVATSGGPGTSASLYLRGAKPDQTKVLIDGLPINSIDASGSPLRFIPLANVERIEILRGPGSMLYGADAVGGVIQIFTRKGTPGLKADGFVGYGSDDTFKTSAGVSAGNERWRFRVEGSHDDFRGISAMRDATNKDGDKDGYRNTGGAISTSFLPAEGHEIGLSFRQNEGRAHYDSGDVPAASLFDAYQDFRTKQWQVFARNRLSANWNSQLQYGQTTDWQKNVSTWSPSGSDFETESRLLSWQNDVSLALGTLVAGLERLEQEARVQDGFDATEISNNSVYIGWNADMGPHRWQLSGRHDDHSEFGSENTYGLAYGYQLTSMLRAQASYGTSFKAPRLDELFHPTWGGNPDLKPEKGENRELALIWDNGVHSVSATYYRNDVEDLITYVSLPPPVWGRNENVQEARLEGLTLAYAGNLGGVDVRATYDWLDATNETTDKRLGRRAEHKAQLDLMKTWGAFQAGMELIAVGSRYNDNNETNKLGGYGLVNLTGRYAINRNLALEARVDNLFDREYELARAYGWSGPAYVAYDTPGLNAFVGIRYTP
ncbi:TonB-dependent receptor [Thauera sp. 2A1]|jgi:vitamin B12 transporter|uniref:TonB-dependent receptor domain-containing protein n=1 Tax=Thauera sp. 2A1 TaxID=2570191 RepID=UPI001884CA32|nr:TonB-dependent receptor [Thauera sp. 2A1]KAI5915578.1 TonB-dependent receptor [Thauera sp. 2A1]MBN8443452.1 TonB-dependent receptor [Thauera sp.]MBV2205603.1 TonB-dependent receptor [Pseudomonas sp.]